jgi:hypothetical protein
VRARIYQPVTRYGVLATDWKYILALSLICYTLPMMTKTSVDGIPLFLLTGPGVMLASYTFFYLVHVGRRPHWLQHRLRSLLRHPVEHGTLSTDQLKAPPRPWLK